MKILSFNILMAVLMLGFVGCDDQSDEANKLYFENASRFSVQIIPLSTEWSGFSLAPGEIRELDDIRDIDFRYEPEEEVQEGSASTERYIIFVDAPPAPETEAPETDTE